MRSEKTLGGLYVFIVLSVMVLFVFGFAAADAATAYYRTRSAESRGWVKVDAVLRSIEYNSRPRGVGSRSVRVLYSYRWGAKQFEGHRYSFYSGGAPIDDAKLFFDKMRLPQRDRIIAVYVNSGRPDQSVIVMESLSLLGRRLRGFIIIVCASFVGVLVAILLIRRCGKASANTEAN